MIKLTEALGDHALQVGASGRGKVRRPLTPADRQRVRYGSNAWAKKKLMLKLTSSIVTVCVIAVHPGSPCKF